MRISISTGSLLAVLAIVSAGFLYFLLLSDKKRWGAHLVFLAVVVAGALVGAKISQFIIDLFIFRQENPLMVLVMTGSNITGGIIGGAAAALIFRLFDREGVANLESFDRLGIVFSVGNAILRIGCFFYGCCFGIIDEHFPLCVNYPDNWIMNTAYHLDLPPGPRLPFPFIASGSLFLISLILIFIYKKTKTPGIALSFFFCLYGVYRFFIEMIRDEPFRLFIGPLSFGQWFGLACIPAGIIFFVATRRKGRMTALLYKDHSVC